MKPTGRQLLSYVPANLLPALAAVAMVVIYTRLLTPAEFGRFNLAYSVVLIGQTVGFNALAFATTRFYPAALRDGTRDAFLRETFSGFALARATRDFRPRGVSAFSSALAEARF